MRLWSLFITTQGQRGTGRIGPAQHIGNTIAGGNQFIQVNAGLYPHAVEHIHHILGGHVAGGTFGVGAAPQPGD